MQIKDNQILGAMPKSWIQTQQFFQRIAAQGEPKQIKVKSDESNYQLGFNSQGQMWLLDWGRGWFQSETQVCPHRISGGECVYCGLVIEGDE